MGFPAVANMMPMLQQGGNVRILYTGATAEESRENLLAWLDALSVEINLQHTFVFDENQHRVPERVLKLQE